MCVAASCFLKAPLLIMVAQSLCVRLLAVSLQVHVRHLQTVQNTHLGQNWLADLTAAWKESGLWITRAKVRMVE
jgi:hypothetical protein